jgi:CRP/FNR family transcriptional regulator/CRP/FNR family cyclic AMP-dependent transcriptional regulator
MPAIARIPAIADVLGEVPIFAALTGEEREELASRMRVRHFARDEVIFHRDDPSGHFFAIVAGTVKLAAQDEGGREVAIAILRGGDVFGELELFDDLPRSVTVQAITETQALALDRQDFFDVLERHPRAMRVMLTQLARTIRDTSRRIEDLVFLDLPSRVAKALLDLRSAHGSNGEVHLTQDDIAAFVGATRASVNRVLADLEQQGILAIGRRHIEIKDLARLQRQVRY